jgi:membrane protease YdiL (CAAX protease family)
MDVSFVFVFAVIYPIAGFIGFRRLLRRIAAGFPVNRSYLYLNTIVWHWVLFALAIIVWSRSGRPWSALGFQATLDTGFIIAAALTLAGIVFLTRQLRQLTAAEQSDLDQIYRQLGQASLLIPRDAAELSRFNILSITAGIVEETLWRGYLIWYLGSFMPLWTAAVISAAGFGIAHAYQGIDNLPRIVLVGGILAGLYLLSGSLWLPMTLHAAIDLLQGRLGYEVLRRGDYDRTS